MANDVFLYGQNTKLSLGKTTECSDKNVQKYITYMRTGQLLKVD